MAAAEAKIHELRMTNDECLMNGQGRQFLVIVIEKWGIHSSFEFRHYPMLYFSMAQMFQTVTDLQTGAEALRWRRYGVIEVRHGQLIGIHLRPWPKLVSIFSVLWGQWYHKHMPGDCVRLYYNQPLRHPNFLAVKFAISARNTGWASARRALEVLDEIAQIKGSDALLCDAASFRLSPRMLEREGWQPHAASRWHRNYIKRFYGSYPRLWTPEVAEETLAKIA
jgi:hypothetical protein